MPTSSHYEVIPGESFESWRDLLTAPGGRDDIRLIPHGEGTTFKATYSHLPSVKPSSRWQVAQQAEVAFWRGWRQNALYGHVNLPEFWQDVIDKTGGPIPPGQVLDVGCGPVSVLNFFRDEGTRPLGLDPLAERYTSEGLVEHREHWQPITLAAVPAEQIPLPTGSVDHVICFNVLDHVADAPAVLAEIHRVLKPAGSYRFYVHTFAPWIKRFLFFDKPHTYHWDHGEFGRLLNTAGFDVSGHLKEPKTFDLPSGWLSKLRHFPYYVATKVAFTSYFHGTKTA